MLNRSLRPASWCRARICLERGGAITARNPESPRSVAPGTVSIGHCATALAATDAILAAGTRVERVDEWRHRHRGPWGRHARKRRVAGRRGRHPSRRSAPSSHPGTAPLCQYIAWRGVIEESEMTQAEHALLFGRMCFCLPAGELLLALGMPGRDADTRPGHRRYYWIWFRPADEAHGLPALCSDAAGRCPGTSIPPHLVRAEVVRDLQQAADTSLAPALAAIIRRTRLPYPHGIFDVETTRMVFGRVLLLGDSAFVARPHVGAGITKAALDAQELADALRRRTPISAIALARYDRQRRAFGSALVERARHLGAYLEAGGEAAEGRRSSGGRRPCSPNTAPPARSAGVSAGNDKFTMRKRGREHRSRARCTILRASLRASSAASL